MTIGLNAAEWPAMLVVSIQMIVEDEVQSLRTGSHPEVTRRDHTKNVRQHLCLLLLVVKTSVALDACRDPPEGVW